MNGRVLITGAGGFLGSHIVECYLERGWTVHGTVRGEAGEIRGSSGDVTYTQIDMRHTESVEALIENVAPDLVLHLAAQSSVSRSWENPLRTLEINIVCQYNLLDALKARRSRARVLVVGSADEYGDVAPEANPIPETAELLPTTPYGLSKVTQDLMGYQFAAQGLDVVRVRPFIQSGPRRSSTFVAGSFARQIAEIERGMRPPVIDVGNIDLVRDFTDVRDVARACMLTVEQGERGAVYNIASGEAHTLRELLLAMLGDSTIDPEIRQVPARSRLGEPPVLVGDASRLRAQTGWQPMISFQQSARDALQYWREQI